MRKRRTRQHIIADLSVNHVERFALLCGYSVERVQRDYGYDLVVYTHDANGEIEPGRIHIQVKATDHLMILADLACWLHVQGYFHSRRELLLRLGASVTVHLSASDIMSVASMGRLGDLKRAATPGGIRHEI